MYFIYSDASLRQGQLSWSAGLLFWEDTLIYKTQDVFPCTNSTLAELGGVMMMLKYLPADARVNVKIDNKCAVAIMKKMGHTRLEKLAPNLQRNHNGTAILSDIKSKLGERRVSVTWLGRLDPLIVACDRGCNTSNRSLFDEFRIGMNIRQIRYLSDEFLNNHKYYRTAKKRRDIFQ